MSRQGSIHRPFYRLVVSDSRRRPGSAAVDTLGYFDPMRRPAVSSVDVARAEEWIRKGAVPSERVAALLKKEKAKAAAKTA